MMKFKVSIFRMKTYSAEVFWIEFRWDATNHCWWSTRRNKYSHGTPQIFRGNPEESVHKMYDNWDIPNVYVDIKRQK